MANTDNKVHYALTNVHIAKLTLDPETGTYTFEPPKRLPGAISLDLAAQGDVVKLKADAMDYYVTHSNNGYEGDLNLAMVPDWFRQDILGDTLAEKDKVLIENSQSESASFALLFEFLGDARRRKHVLYNCSASRPSIKGENKDNQKEPDTEALTLSAVPLPDGLVKTSTTADTPKTVDDAWYTSVWVKDSVEG